MNKPALEPMLSVRQGAKAVSFYKQAFGAEELFCHTGENGEIVAQLSISGANFWVADESPQHFNFSPETLNGGTVRMILIVENPEDAFQRAVAEGAEVVYPITEEYGWRAGRVVDPYGHHWEIGKPLKVNV